MLFFVFFCFFTNSLVSKLMELRVWVPLCSLTKFCIYDVLGDGAGATETLPCTGSASSTDVRKCNSFIQ